VLRGVLGALGVAAVAGLALTVILRDEPDRQRVAPPPRTDGIAVRDLGHAWALTNADGTWTVEKRCRSGPRFTVGPGYVSRLVTHAGETLVDDVRERGTLNDPRYGGLAAFGWHHSRGRPGRLRFSGDNAWEISGRRCARDSGGFGVSASRVLRAPDGGAAEPELVVEVLFADAFTHPRPLARVRYGYRLRPDELVVRITVTELCPGGRCGRTRARAFVKEPKLVAHVTAPWLDRTVTFDAAGEPVCRYEGAGAARGPILETGQCADEGRERVRFEGGDGCRAGPCLDVHVRSLRGPWAGAGLDEWARRSGERPAAFPRDTASLDGLVWSCHTRTPAAPIHRRWETAARRDASGRPVAVGVLFPAWEGGRGTYDCEPLARAFGPRGESFAVALAFSLSSSG
jgi:hypothetical protein